MSDLQIDDTLLVPGDIVAFDYELLTQNATVRDWAISQIKGTIWADDRLDYQGSTVFTLGDLELQRDVEILRVFAQVRKTRRDTRLEIQTASLSSITAAISVALVGLGVYLVLRGAAKFMGTMPDFATASETVKSETGLSLPTWAIIGVALYLAFFKKWGKW